VEKERLLQLFQTNDGVRRAIWYRDWGIVEYMSFSCP
jgi:hypothetical protein